MRALGHRFSCPELLEQALTHRSAGWPNNERLEFLGDALINMIVAEALFRRWPRADEGALTRARSQLVREASLAGLARGFQLGEEMTLGAGELKSGGWRRDSILADALEALVGAIFLDAGFETCREAVTRWFGKVLDALPEALRTDKDPKTRLQEWLQARALPRPDYQLLATRGEEHERIFDVRCMVPHAAVATEGTAASRRQAEQIAAEAALRLLEELRDDR